MPLYPVSVNAKTYSGSDPKKTAKHHLETEQARAIEGYLNEQMESSDRETVVFTYGNIATALGIDKAAVRKLLYPVGRGDNGITVRKRGENGNGD